MTLRLSIENMDRLPDGGPLRVEVKGRGLDLGRDAHLDWTLPDPSRTVSSKHCEIRFRDGGYWLHDVSTNGTFVNGAQFRLDGPYMLRDGDRLAIGPYIIAVAVQGQAAPAAAGFAGAAPAAAMSGDVWGAVGEAAAPDDRAAYRIQERRERPPDFLDFAASVSPAEPAPDLSAPLTPGTRRLAERKAGAASAGRGRAAADADPAPGAAAAAAASRRLSRSSRARPRAKPERRSSPASRARPESPRPRSPGATRRRSPKRSAPSFARPRGIWRSSWPRAPNRKR